MRIRFKDFDIIPVSPPIATKRDFCVFRINLPPKRTIEKLTLGAHHPVIGFISEGFNIKIHCRDKLFNITANQAFSLDGSFPHDILNDDEDHAAVIYLITKYPNYTKLKPGRQAGEKRSDSINIAGGIDKIRQYRSDRPDHLIAIKHLADLTDSLNHEQVMKLMRIKRGSSVIYWEKIEDLLAATGISMDEFLLWCRRQGKSYFSMATAGSRAIIDYSAYYGVKIFSCVPSNSRNEFFCGEILIEGQATRPGKSWERKDTVMVAVYVEEGEIEITVGKRRSPLTLLKGESVYFDGALGYSLRNPSEVQAKGFFASSPGIVF